MTDLALAGIIDGFAAIGLMNFAMALPVASAAEALLKVGESAVDPLLDKRELAGWTTLASTILNLDEVITKE